MNGCGACPSQDSMRYLKNFTAEKCRGKERKYSMTAKEYLSQAYRIDQRINGKLSQVMALRDLLGKATATLSGAPKPATRYPHTMEDAIAKIVDLESEINEDIDALVDLKADITRRIKRVENTEYQTILELRYLCFKQWEEVAADLGYTQRHMFRLHELALKSIRVPYEVKE